MPAPSRSVLPRTWNQMRVKAMTPPRRDSPDFSFMKLSSSYKFLINSIWRSFREESRPWRVHILGCRRALSQMELQVCKQPQDLTTFRILSSAMISAMTNQLCENVHGGVKFTISETSVWIPYSFVLRTGEQQCPLRLQYKVLKSG